MHELNIAFTDTNISDAKKSDILYLIEIPELNTIYQDTLFDKPKHTFLKRLPIIFYIGGIQKNEEGNETMFQLKPKKSASFNKDTALWFPSSLFKIVKKPRLNDVLDWAYNQHFPQSVKDFPQELLIFKDEMSSIARYIIEIFQYNPKWLNYLNKHLNHLYVTNDPIEVLIFIKTLILHNKISRYTLFTKYYPQSKREKFIKVAQELYPLMTNDDVISHWDLNRRAILKMTYKSNEDRLDEYLFPGKKRDKSADRELLDEIKKINQQVSLDKIRSDSRFIEDITQEVIDNLELVIFDVTSLEASDQLLYIFIDKDNNKRFYLQDFNFVFYVSKGKRIIDNDYIVSYDELEHIPFAIQNFEVLRNLKFAVNDSYKRFMKKGGF